MAALWPAGGRGDERHAVASSGKPYGLARVCRIWRSAWASIYRHRYPVPARPTPGPVGPMPDVDLLEWIRGVLSDSPFHGEGHRKVWARLRIGGIRTSLRRVLRVMRENDLLAPGRLVNRADRATTTAPSSPRASTPCGAPT